MYNSIVILEILILNFSETGTTQTGLLVEVWSKNIILDRVLGFQYIHLDSLPYNQYDYGSSEQWVNIDTEQITHNGEIQGTKDPTGHLLLLDLHFELPFEEADPQNQGFHGNFTNQDQYIENFNDYQKFNDECHTFYDCSNQQQTNYEKNFGQTLPTPHSSLETSRQNSYERDERQYYDINNFYNQDYSPTFENGEMNDGEYDDGALFYNSRPFKSVF